MYSKDRGISFDAEHLSASRAPAYRQPSRPRMQVPPNYSGHAIVDGEERPLGVASEPEPAEDAVVLLSSDEPPSPHFDDLPRVSDLPTGGARESRRSLPLPVSVASEAPSGGASLSCERLWEEKLSAPEPTEQPPARGGLFDLSRFPFGHGMGMEELLIIGLILFLLHENAACEERGDLDETVILLGLLLLLG